MTMLGMKTSVDAAALAFGAVLSIVQMVNWGVDQFFWGKVFWSLVVFSCSSSAMYVLVSGFYKDRLPSGGGCISAFCRKIFPTLKKLRAIYWFCVLVVFVVFSFKVNVNEFVSKMDSFVIFQLICLVLTSFCIIFESKIGNKRYKEFRSHGIS
jgi:hypothetical protein